MNSTYSGGQPCPPRSLWRLAAAALHVQEASPSLDRMGRTRPAGSQCNGLAASGSGFSAQVTISHSAARIAVPANTAFDP